MAVDIEQQRADIREAVPEAIAQILEVMRKPGRNSGVRLQAAKTILDRAGLQALTDVSVHDPSGNPLTVNLTVHGVSPTKPREPGA